VGDVPRQALDAYMACINQARHISLSSMRAHYREQAQKTPFGNLDWDKGFMHFRYMNVSLKAENILFVCLMDSACAH